jgi:transcriptional regulator GlxA family with amidase domain
VRAALRSLERYLRFAQRLRMAHAVHLLETTQRSVDAVAAAVG